MKKAALIVKCSGEAHNPEVGGMIDNCMSCAPYWEMMSVCPVMHKVMVNYAMGPREVETRIKLNAETGFCKHCKKFYALPKR